MLFIAFCLINLFLGITAAVLLIAIAKDYRSYPFAPFTFPLGLYWDAMSDYFTQVGCWATSILIFLLCGIGFSIIYLPYGVGCLWLFLFRKKKVNTIPKKERFIY